MSCDVMYNSLDVIIFDSFIFTFKENNNSLKQKSIHLFFNRFTCAISCFRVHAVSIWRPVNYDL